VLCDHWSACVCVCVCVRVWWYYRCGHWMTSSSGCPECLNVRSTYVRTVRTWWQLAVTCILAPSPTSRAEMSLSTATWGLPRDSERLSITRAGSTVLHTSDISCDLYRQTDWNRLQLGRELQSSMATTCITSLYRSQLRLGVNAGMSALLGGR